MSITFDDILKTGEDFKSDKDYSRVSKYKKYKEFRENHVGRFFKERLIKNLRLQDEVSTWLNEDGYIGYHLDNRFIPYTLNNQKLTIEDLIVECTLPKSAITVLKNFSVGEKPTVITGTEEEGEWVKEFEKREIIHSKLKEIVTELLTLGNCYTKIERIDKKAEMTPLPAENILLIPAPHNARRLGAYLYYEERLMMNDKKEEGLYVELHLKGENIVRAYRYAGNKIGAQIPLSEINRTFTVGKNIKDTSGKGQKDFEYTINTELEDFDIQNFMGLDKDIGELYAESIYNGLSSTFLEMTIRITSNSYLFNKVNNPNMIGPDVSETQVSLVPTWKENALGTEYREEKVVKQGKYHVINDSKWIGGMKYVEPPTSHVETIYRHLELNYSNAYSQLGVNAVALGLINISGSISSGEAFKKAITPTLNKARDIVNNIYTPLVTLYKQAYKLEKKKEFTKFDIGFSDGISLSEKEEIENASLEVNSKLKSRKTYLMENGYTEKAADEELERIAEEQDRLSGMSLETIIDEDIGGNDE